MAKLHLGYERTDAEFRPLLGHGGSYDMFIRGVHYIIGAQVYVGATNVEFRQITLSVRRVVETLLFSPVFSTKFGGVYGYVLPLETGEEVVVMWRSAREFCALHAIVRQRGIIPIRVVKCVGQLAVGEVDLRVVCVSHSELLPSSSEAVMPAPMLSYSHNCTISGVEDGPLATIIHCKILLNGDLVLHGVTFCPQFGSESSATDVDTSRGFRRYTPRGVQSNGLLCPSCMISWGMEGGGFGEERWKKGVICDDICANWSCVRFRCIQSVHIMLAESRGPSGHVDKKNSPSEVVNVNHGGPVYPG